MEIAQMINQFQGQPLKMDQLSEFWQQFLTLFTNPKIIQNPYVSTTLQYDLTEIYKYYQDVERQRVDKGSFSAYFSYRLLKACSQVEPLTWRCINGSWYAFDNLPAFFPVAISGEKRYGSAVLENFIHHEWPHFFKCYRRKIEEAKQGLTPNFLDMDIYLLAHSISIVPHLLFTAITHHLSAQTTTRIVFVLGQRYEENGRLMIPLTLHAHHANCDGLVIEALFKALRTG